MRTVEIPGGTARFREGRSEMRGRDDLLISAASAAAASVIAKVPENTPIEGETPAQAEERALGMLQDMQLTWQEAQAMLEVRQAMVVATLESWTLEQPLPTMANIGDLPGDLYQALLAASEEVPVEAVATFEPDPDEASPTPPSSASDGGLRALTESKSIRTRPRAGASTATGNSIPA